jgi:hypothetical protein
MHTRYPRDLVQVEDPPIVDEPDHVAVAAQAPAPFVRWSNPIVRRVVWLTVGVATLMAVIAAVVGTWSRLPDFEWRLRPGWLVLAGCAFLALHLSHAGLWRLVMHRLGRTVEARRSRAIWCVSGLARYTPGSVLMPMVRVAMARPEGVPKRECLASVVYEMALTLTGAAIVGAYAIVRTPDFGGDARFLVLVIPMAALVCLHPRIFKPVADVALNRIGKQSLPRALRPGSVLTVAALYSASWLLAGAGLYALIQGLHPIHPNDFLVVLAAPAVGYIAAALAFVLPGGLGAREGGLAVVLSVALPLAVAVAIAVALRLLQLALELGVAAVTPIVAQRTRPR